MSQIKSSRPDESVDPLAFWMWALVGNMRVEPTFPASYHVQFLRDDRPEFPWDSKVIYVDSVDDLKEQLSEFKNITTAQRRRFC